MSYAPLIAALVTMLITAIVLAQGFANNINEAPAGASLPEKTVPRFGGVGLLAGILSGWASIFSALPLWMLLPVILLFAISLMDDIGGISVSLRFASHVIIALGSVWSIGLFSINFLWAIGAVLATVWIARLYNHMDGADGLTGGMTFVGFTIYGVAALMADDKNLAMMCFAVGAASLGFLYFNFYPAKVSMGSSGAIPLGFLAALIGLMGWNKNLWPVWFPLMVFSPFLLDAAITTLKFLLRREKIGSAKQEYYYQKAVKLALGQRNAVLIEYFIMVAVGSTALWALAHPDALINVILSWLAIYVVGMLFLDNWWKVNPRA
jgi:UDP-N-acetylmuramyl pentapeptide phosphotransferase/UDP-N-acetylglucosamine-1-phosphate transferase